MIILSLLLSAVPAPALEGWSQILATRVSDKGLVDYAKIASDDRAKLDAFLAAVAAAPVPADKSEAIALYADAYNALVIKKVIENKRPRSVLDVKGFFDSGPEKIAGQMLTLDALEKKVVAPLASPGHHFILVCGAVGCPKLEKKSFSADPSGVHKRMDAAAKAYLSTPRGAVVAKDSVQLSKIFEWYAADFGGAAGVLKFVKQHVQIADGSKVSSLEYDWTLNQP